MAQALETKKKIASAFKVLVAGSEYGKVTIDDIAKKAGVTRQAFYYHFADKDALSDWIFEEEYLKKYPMDPEMSAYDEMLKVCRYLCREQKYYRQVLLHTFPVHMSAACSEVLSRELARRGITGYGGGKTTPEDFLKLCTFMVIEVIRNWITEKESVDPEELMEIFRLGLITVGTIFTKED